MSVQAQPLFVLRPNGVRLYTERFGRGTEPVLFLSSATLQCIWWLDEHMQHVAATGTKCAIRMDTRDVGLSSGCTEPYRMQDLAEDAFAVLDAHGMAHRRVVVVGHSMGAMVGQIMLLTRPERVVRTIGFGAGDITVGFERLANPPRPVGSDAERLALSRRVGSVYSDEFLLGMYARERERRASPEADASADPCRHWDVLARSKPAAKEAQLAAVADRVIFIHGNADGVAPYEATRRVAEACGATLVTLEGHGHVLTPEVWSCVARELDLPRDAEQLV